MNADQRIAELLSQPAQLDGDDTPETDAERGADPVIEPVAQARVASTPEPGTTRRSNRPSNRPPRRTGLAALALRANDGPAARFREVIDAVARSVRARPVAAIASSLAVGFLVGGALSFRAGRLLLATGARHVAREVLKQML